ncbi:MAG: hypothetical protein EBW87_00445 [Burkholderiaceae bacterium]|nr:hypothetical protein [Burkholderiaceae bacterium]
MATSAGLAWSLANGISQEQYDKNLADAYAKAQAQGLTDAQIESNMNQYGISAADVARATKISEASLQARLDAATPTTPAEIAYNQAAMAELAGRQAQWDAAQAKNVTDWAAQQKANEAAWAAKQKQNELDWAAKQKQNVIDWAEQQRLNAIKNAQQIAANEAAWKKQQELNVIKNQQQIAANEAAWAAKQRQNEVDWAKQQAQVGPLANATQGFEQNFRNYQSIAPGAQYDPSVTGGMSPYGQIMGQMKPLGNPYANVQGGMPLGGYNPGLYDQIAAANTAKTAAASGANLTAQQLAQNSLGLESSSTGGLANGGMVHGGLMFGPNPPGPDDGAVNLDMGEYVIKKDAVNKYGRGLLDMINEGKVPAKKLKSLLG